ncbi:MAG: class I SAM-dependent methyltransferase [Candidatus Niyogibacteria bacterium]|nr:class I SAM-dependent methyltransferase [Candidatus Niyogibacteria bacterium]
MSFIQNLTAKPAILDFLRKLLENNHRGEKQVILNELPDRISKKVLDLGCGTGAFSPFFGPDYIGMDISEKYIEYARHKYSDRTFLAGDAQTLDFPASFFDIIFVNGVLHHLDDDTVLKITREINRVLRPEGRALIMENILNETLLSKLIAMLDLGKYIRPSGGYRRLLAEYFNIADTYPIRMGICDYQVFVLTKN